MSNASLSPYVGKCKHEDRRCVGESPEAYWCPTCGSLLFDRDTWRTHEAAFLSEYVDDGSGPDPIRVAAGYVVEARDRLYAKYDAELDRLKRCLALFINECIRNLYPKMKGCRVVRTFRKGSAIWLFLQQPNTGDWMLLNPLDMTVDGPPRPQGIMPDGSECP